MSRMELKEKRDILVLDCHLNPHPLTLHRLGNSSIQHPCTVSSYSPTCNFIAPPGAAQDVLNDSDNTLAPSVPGRVSGDIVAFGCLALMIMNIVTLAILPVPMTHRTRAQATPRTTMENDSDNEEEELPARDSDGEEPQPRVKSSARQSREKGIKKGYESQLA
ncbi:hypothetical protein C8F01DRAFT_1252580 [Mycena amicta]|nr:hypothetical protein C8F01DRAFT_1252580 [Mycena amicta]